MEETQDSVCVSRKQCPECAANGRDNSKDNLAIYSDGHGFCFSCGYYGGIDGSHVSLPKRDTKFIRGNCTELTARRINDKTVSQYRYEVGEYTFHGERSPSPVHIANYYRDGQVVAQHVRDKNKRFAWIGDTSCLTLYGQQLWRHGGRRVVITEGEIDCLTVAQTLNNSWPVVSIPNGVLSAEKCIKQNLDFLQGYDEIVIMFDMDEPGQDAAHKVAAVLPPGTAKIASLPYKDANECLKKNDSKAIMTGIWEAHPWSPDEILHVKEIPEVTEEKLKVWPYPWLGLTLGLTGQRSGEIVNWTSATGSGKSTIGRAIAMDHLKNGRKVGMIMLEESPQETIDDLLSLMIKQPVRVLKAREVMKDLLAELDGVDEVMDFKYYESLNWEKYHQARQELNDMGLFIYDHLGRSGVTNLLARVEYLAVACEVDVIVLDHITAAATGLLSKREQDDERKLIDAVMAFLREICVRTGVHIDIVSQLTKNGKTYEEGARITMNDLKGAGSLGSVPNVVVALERNRQHPDLRLSNTTAVRALKNRLDGRSGVVSALWYNHATSELEEVPFALDDNGNLVLKPE